MLGVQSSLHIFTHDCVCVCVCVCVVQHLMQQQEALTQLVRTVKEGFADLQCIEEGFN